MKLLKCTRLSFLTLLSFLLISCEELTGPPGEDGKDGVAGEDGKDGVANIIVKEISFSKWDIEADENSVHLIENIPEITSNVVDSGVVIVDIGLEEELWSGLPITLSIDLDDSIMNVDLALFIGYHYEVGKMSIEILSSTEEVGSDAMEDMAEDLFLGPYKVTIIPPSASP